MDSHDSSRRQFIKTSIAATALATLPFSCTTSSKKLYDISIAQWSVWKRIRRGKPVKMDVFGKMINVSSWSTNVHIKMKKLVMKWMNVNG